MTGLPLEELDESIYFRICRTDYSSSEPYFGKSGVYRFDSPDHQFGTLYCAELFKTCFGETMIRDRPGMRIQLSEYQARSLSLISINVAKLKIVSMHGDQSRNMGYESSDLIGKDYTVTQNIARDIYNHSDEPDGMAYMSRFNSPKLALVLFDRAKPHVEVLPGYESRTLSSTPALADAVRQRLKFSFY